jgi:hypothetical protein
VLGPIKSTSAKAVLLALAISVAMAVGLSVIFHVPYVFTAIGLSVWAFFGHLVTVDEDKPGGWSNLHNQPTSSWLSLLAKAGLLALLCAIVVLFPALRSLGS